MKFYTSIDIYQNELKQARIHNVASFPSSPVTGQIFYNSTNGVMYYYSGSAAAWVPMYGAIKNVLAGHGLVRTATANTGYGDTITLDVNPGAGLAVNGAFVELKNAANLSDGILPKWDVANSQFVDSIAKELTGVVYVTGGLQSNYWQADLLASTTTGVGKLRWNNQDGTLEFGLIGGNVNLQVGQEQVVRVVNKTGGDLQEAAYQAVKISGAQGNRLKVGLARADVDANSADTIGIVTETILSNQEGFVTSSGLVRNINTTGSLQSETWADGDVLYLSPTTFGAITNIKPQAPQHTVILGFVVRAHATQGQIYVKVDNGYEIDELHNVRITSVANGQFLVYNTTLGVWENKTVNTGVNGTGITNYVARWSDTDTLTTGVLYDNGTNVGIGATNPTSKLFVDSISDSYIAKFVTSDNNYSTVVVGDTGDVYSSFYLETDGGNGQLFKYGAGWGVESGMVGLYSSNGPIALQAGGSTRLFTSAAGNVGINTILPSEKLHVSGNIRVTGAFHDSTNSPGLSGQVLTSTATGTDWKSLSEISGVDGTGTANYMAMWTDSDTIGISQIYQDPSFNGIVIGPTSTYGFPALSVEGTIYVHDFVDNTSTIMTAGGPLFKYDGPLGYLRIGNSVREDYINDKTRFGHLQNFSIEVHQNGNVGIINTGPQYVLDVFPPGTSSDWFNGVRAPYFSTEGSFNNVEDVFNGTSIKSKIGFPVSQAPHRNTDIAFYTTSTLLYTFPYHTDMTSEKMRITYDGKLLIGTSVPSSGAFNLPLLEVNGSAWIYENTRTGSLLVASPFSGFSTGRIDFGDTGNVYINGGSGVAGFEFSIFNQIGISLTDYSFGTNPDDVRVGIGTYATYEKLTVNGSSFSTISAKSPYLEISDSTAYSYWRLYQSGVNFTIKELGGSTDMFVISSDYYSYGYVGINTTAPQSRLHVVGDIQFGSSFDSYIKDVDGKYLMSYQDDFNISGAKIFNINPTGGGFGPSVVTIGYGTLGSQGYGLEVGVSTRFHNPVDVESSINVFNDNINVYNGTVKIDDVDIKSLMIAFSVALG